MYEIVATNRPINDPADWLEARHKARDALTVLGYNVVGDDGGTAFTDPPMGDAVYTVDVLPAIDALAAVALALGVETVDVRAVTPDRTAAVGTWSQAVA